MGETISAEKSSFAGAEGTAAADAAVRDGSGRCRKATWRDFIQMTKPGILISNTVTAFAGFWMASGRTGAVDIPLLLYTLLGTLLVMASGCVLNNYLDRDFDARMERTRNRALASGTVAPRTALVYGLALGAAGLSVLALFVGPLAAALGFAGWFVYVFVYTLWLKRTSVHSTAVGGIAGAMPPVIGYVAVAERLDLGAWLLFLLLFLWQPPHFWALGIRRRDEYRRAGYPLLPVVRGVSETKWAIFQYTVLLAPVSLLPYLYGYAGVVYVLTAAALGLAWAAMVTAWLRSDREDDRWAKRMFVFSVYYLTIVSVVLALDTTFVRESVDVPLELERLS